MRLNKQVNIQVFQEKFFVIESTKLKNGNKMRIISGIYRGFKLKEFSGRDIRPTPAMVRESLFDMFAAKIVDAEFLDLFSGTGAIGIEALSRGARKVTFVDHHPRAIQLIKENLSRIQHQDDSTVIQLDYLKALNHLDQQQSQFDIIFLDPPYHQDYIYKSLQAIDRGEVLKKNGFVVIQHPCEWEQKNNLNNIFFLKEKRYGKSGITIFRSKERF